MTNEEIVEALERVGRMTVELDAVPTPPALQIQIKTVRDHLSTARRYLNRMRQMHRLVSSELSTLESEFEMNFIELIATDDEVKAGGSVTDRKALAKWRLKDDIKKIESKKNECAGFEAAEKMVWEVIKDLEGTSTDISRQMKLLRLDEALGGDPATDGNTEGRGELPSDDVDLLDMDSDSESEFDSESESEDDLGLGEDGDPPVTGTSHLSATFGDEDESEPEDDSESESESEDDIPTSWSSTDGHAPVEEPEAIEPEKTEELEIDPDDEWANLIDGVENPKADTSSDLSDAQKALRRIVVSKPKKTSSPPPASDEDIDDLLDDEI